jgi:transcriptional regulator GlxA family with amidase domain
MASDVRAIAGFGGNTPSTLTKTNPMSIATANLDAFRYYERLERIHVYVAGHIGEPISLHRAANLACLGAKYFSAFFRQKTGVCFSAWLREQRVEHAAVLISNRDESVSRVASRVGFGSVRTFERAFRRRFGISPRDFKRLVRPG